MLRQGANVAGGVWHGGGVFNCSVGLILLLFHLLQLRRQVVDTLLLEIARSPDVFFLLLKLLLFVGGELIAFRELIIHILFLGLQLRNSIAIGLNSLLDGVLL